MKNLLIKSTRINRVAQVLLAAMVFVGMASEIHAQTLVVGGSANIFAAGQGSPLSGSLPPVYNFTAGAGQVFQFHTVTGTITSGYTFGPDGESSISIYSDMAAYNGISGIKADTAFFLAGVFLDDNAPSMPAPASLDFSSTGMGSDYFDLEPMIGQTFLIGDGRIGQGGTGAVQLITAPSTATRLFLGTIDGDWTGVSVVGAPNNYGDNGGAFTAEFSVSTVPEPSTNALMSGVVLFAGFYIFRRKMKATAKVQDSTSI